MHGRYDLLSELLCRIAAESPAALPVLVGDLIDRGPDSRAVLGCARGLGAGGVVLRGNHEQMLIDFLDAPDPATARWLRHGGAETLASFGVAGSGDPVALRDALRAALPAGLEDWLRALPLSWQSGNLAVVHAGADPRRPIADQDPAHLLWGHPGFGRFPRRDGLWIAHGHTIVAQPRARDGVIAVDTGVWQGGPLSAALISDDGVDFIGTGA